MTRTAIFDIDGVLANTGDFVSKFISKKGNFMEDKFNEEILNFSTIEQGVEMLKHFKYNDYTIVLVTARREQFRPNTEQWLKNNDIPYDFLYHRVKGANKVDYKIMIAKRFKPLFIIDDDPEIVKGLRSKGFYVYQPNNNYEILSEEVYKK